MTSNTKYIERANHGLHDFVFEQLVKPLMPLESVLDIGCGSGAWLHRLQEHGVSRLMGLDTDTAQFAAEGISHRAINLDRYDSEHFGSYQVITCIELIEHLENPGGLIRLIANHLSPGGSCIITTPNTHSRFARLRYALKGELGHFDSKSDPTHIYPVYTANLRKILQRNGLTIHSVLGFTEIASHNYSFPIRSLAALLTLFLAKTFEGDNIIYTVKHTG